MYKWGGDVQIIIFLPPELLMYSTDIALILKKQYSEHTYGCFSCFTSQQYNILLYWFYGVGLLSPGG